MKMTASDIARALVHSVKDASEKDLPGLLDAALELLQKNALLRQLRIFPRLVEEARVIEEGILPVLICTPAGTLGPAKSDILDALQKLLQKKLEVTDDKDPSLIGGAVVSFGDERFDFSLRHALSSFRA